ncbi:MAG: septation regulator SpoVG [Oscillospiraceae bacterium]|nr:septation regulator SpoVG [Oscillospiraceae bacterium]
MNITDIRVRRTYSEGRLRALVSITLDNDFAVHDVKVIEGPQRLFVAMPSRKDENGVFRDIVHPITTQARTILEDSILDAYRRHQEQSQQFSAPRDDEPVGEEVSML